MIVLLAATAASGPAQAGLAGRCRKLCRPAVAECVASFTIYESGYLIGK
jgi:hypothetical protein